MTSEKQLPSTIESTPKLELFSFKELEEMALHVTLSKMGVKHPRSFLDENKVTFTSMFKVSVGMSVVVLSITPETEAAPSQG